MVAQDAFQPLGRSSRPCRDDDPFAGGAQTIGVSAHRLIDIGPGFDALGCEIAALPAAHREDRRRSAVRCLEGGEGEHRSVGEKFAPFLLREIERIGLQRLVGCGAEGFLVQRFAPRIMELGDLLETCAHRLIGRMVERDRHFAHMIEDGFELLVEERQPMLHALIAPAVGHRFIKGIIDVKAAEGGCVGRAEAPDRLGCEQHLACRMEHERAQCAGRALRLRIEAPHRLERIAEEIKPDRSFRTRGIDINDAAANGEVAGIDDGAGARIAILLEEELQLLGIDILSGCGGECRLGNDPALRQSLQHGIDAGEHDARLLGGNGDQSQGRQAPRDDIGRRRHAVIGQAVPGRKGDDLDIGGEEGERLGKACHALII